MTELDIPEFVLFIIKQLHRAGHQAYIVGGAVRDACLGRPATDWDVATSATARNIRTIFIKNQHFSLGHDTVTLVDSGSHFEVTPFKGKTGSLDEDLFLRDFTIDAIAYDTKKKRIIDPLGGKRDILNKLIRSTGDPESRFREDPLRLLRGVRLHAELGFSIEKDTIRHINTLAPLLHNAASERIREELVKILLCKRPSTAFYLAVRTGILQQFLPELLEGYMKRQNAYHRYTIFRHTMETVNAVEPIPVLRLTALLHDVAKPRVRKKVDGIRHFYGHDEASADLAKKIMGRLKFSKEMTGKVTHLIRHHMISYHAGWGQAAVRRFIRRVGTRDIADLIRFRRADIKAHGLETTDMKLLDELEQRIKDQLRTPSALSTKDLAINGEEVMENLRLSPGPEVGKTLNSLLEKVIERPELNNKKALLGLLADHRKR